MTASALGASVVVLYEGRVETYNCMLTKQRITGPFSQVGLSSPRENDPTTMKPKCA